MQSNDALLYMIQQKINHRLIHTGLTIDVEITRKSSLITPILYLDTKSWVVDALPHLGGEDTIAITVISALARCWSPFQVQHVQGRLICYRATNGIDR